MIRSWSLEGKQGEDVDLKTGSLGGYVGPKAGFGEPFYQRFLQCFLELANSNKKTCLVSRVTPPNLSSNPETHPRSKLKLTRAVGQAQQKHAVRMNPCSADGVLSLLLQTLRNVELHVVLDYGCTFFCASHVRARAQRARNTRERSEREYF